MRRFSPRPFTIAVLVIVLAAAGPARAQISGSTAAATDVPDSSEDDWQAQAAKRTSDLHAAWLAEKDSTKRGAVADDLISAAMDSNDSEVIAEVVRGGPGHERFLSVPQEQREIRLEPLTVLTGAKAVDNPSQYEHDQSTLFRRKLLEHVRVPRRDGDGGPWKGAFLPSGKWLTTDLWNDDRQLNCFSPGGKWLWELTGEEIHPPERQPIHWARSDKWGRGWVVSVGQDDDFEAWISPDGKARAVPGNNPWALTYPRAMQAKGVFCELRLPSDDGKAMLFQNSASHGNGIDYPTYHWDGWGQNLRVPFGDAYFGFWPGSQATWMEGDQVTWLSGTSSSNVRKIWFFDAQGNYRAELAAGWLGDAADGKSLLFCDGEDRVIEVTPALAVTARQFCWASGRKARPLAIYDELRLGFFTDPKTGWVILARW